MAPRDQPTENAMSFGEHLEELRRRILHALALPIPAAVIIFFFSNTLIDWLLLPLYKVLSHNGLPPQVQQGNPAEGVVTQIKLSLISAVIVSAPWILWQVWKFVGPGLYLHERRFVRFLIPGSGVLTAAAVALTYWVLLPFMLHVLVAMSTSIGATGPLTSPSIDARAMDILNANPPIPIYGSRPEHPVAGAAWLELPDLKRFVAVANPEGTVSVVEAPFPQSGAVAQLFRLGEYVGFVLLFLLGTVIAFQMPLVVALLGWVGLASVEWLRSHRKYALFICAVAAAAITPTADVISMFVLLIPLYALYELGILLLVIAPASAVAEGKVLDWRRWRQAGSDKQAAQSDHSHKAAQPDSKSARREPPDESPARPTDGGEVSP